jgi:uncharacterized protein (DUF1778 family)
MARPRKEPRLRKDADLRIPLTAEQKELIAQAAALDQSDMAAWVRPLLIQAAQLRVARQSVNQQPVTQPGARRSS